MSAPLPCPRCCNGEDTPCATQRSVFDLGEASGTEAERARFRALLAKHVRYAHNVAILPADVIAELLGGEP